MAWRIQVTNNGISQSDFVYGLGTISLVSFLELWLGIIIVCLPTLAPLFAKYVKPVVSKITGVTKKPDRRQLREAQNTIGGSTKRGYRKNFDNIRKDSYLELEEGSHFSNAEATGRPAPTPEDDEPWMNEPYAIGIRHDIHIYDTPEK